MDFLMAFLLMVSLVSTESAKSTKVKKRLNVLEKRFNKLESRVSVETGTLQVDLSEVSDRVAYINATLSQIKAVCRNDCSHTSIRQTTKTKVSNTIPQASLQITEKRVMAAFSEEKVKIREAFDRIDKHLEEFDLNNTRQTKQEIKTVVADYNDLKKTVETINATIVDIQEDLLSEIETAATEMKQKIALSSEELKKLVNAQIKDLKTAIENKYEPIRECPNNWNRYGLFCYRFFNDEVNYSDAEQMCADTGASVVDIQSQGESDFVLGLSGEVENWIGLTDIEEEGTWKWKRTNSEALFVNWRPGQPDSFQGKQDCVIAGNERPYDKWNDIQCIYSYPFVCKKPA